MWLIESAVVGVGEDSRPGPQLNRASLVLYLDPCHPLLYQIRLCGADTLSAQNNQTIQSASALGLDRGDFNRL